MTKQEIIEMIQRAGFEAVERDAVYNRWTNLEGSMRVIFFAAVVVLLIPVHSSAQNAAQSKLEQTIRKLDADAANAILNKDIAALEKLWAPDYTVNSPSNIIYDGRAIVIDLVKNGTIDYTSVDREIEKILFHGDTVITMGSETIKPVGKARAAGQTVRRRYTHFWKKRDGKWLLSARHANVICQ